MGTEFARSKSAPAGRRGSMMAVSALLCGAAAVIASAPDASLRVRGAEARRQVQASEAPLPSGGLFTGVAGPSFTAQEPGLRSVALAQPPVEDDTGVGPFGMLALASSCPFGLASADDFTLPTDTPITRIIWHGVYFAGDIDYPGDDRNVRITIYADNGAGNVGQPLLELDNLGPIKTRHPRAPIFGVYPVYTYAVDLDEPFVAQAGVRYWLSINIDPAGGLGPVWGWVSSRVGNAAATPELDQPLHDVTAPCPALPARNFVPGGPQGLDGDLAFTLVSSCAASDCNCNDQDDAVDIATGASADCNRNGVPDECDIGAGTSTDCDGDGVPDECQLRRTHHAVSANFSPTGAGNPHSFPMPGAPRARGPVRVTVSARSDLSLATENIALELNGQHIATLFVNGGHDCPATPDTEAVEIPDAVFNAALDSGTAVFRLVSSLTVATTLCGSQQFVSMRVDYEREDSTDLNGNGIYDACDIASGHSGDCDRDGVPDELQLGAPFQATVSTSGPFGYGAPLRLTVDPAPEAYGSVLIRVRARGDFSEENEYVDVLVNGQAVGRLFVQGGHDCPPTPDEGVIELHEFQYSSLVQSGGGRAVIEARPNYAVSPTLCSLTGFASVSLELMERGGADCDGDGVPDACAVASGLAPDYNGNGRPDACDRPGDITGDDLVNSADLAVLLADWGTSRVRSDLNGNGFVEASDLSMLLSYMAASHR